MLKLMGLSNPLAISCVNGGDPAAKEIFSTQTQFKNGQEIKVRTNLLQRIYVNMSDSHVLQHQQNIYIYVLYIFLCIYIFLYIKKIIAREHGKNPYTNTCPLRMFWHVLSGYSKIRRAYPFNHIYWGK